MWNCCGPDVPPDCVSLGQTSFDVLKGTEATAYLGVQFCFEDSQATELHNRVAKAWAKFGIYRSELTDKHYDVAKRLQLFATVVQPTFLYGCVNWTLTRDMEYKIRTTQRKMVRAIIGLRRDNEHDVLEDYVDWIRRSTRLVEEIMHNHSIPNWVQEIHRRPFDWAGTIARRIDGRWTHALLNRSAIGRRARGRPRLRWTDNLNKFFHSSGIARREGGSIDNSFWIALAADETSWAELRSDFESFVSI